MLLKRVLEELPLSLIEKTRNRRDVKNRAPTTEDLKKAAHAGMELQIIAEYISILLRVFSLINCGSLYMYCLHVDES